MYPTIEGGDHVMTSRILGTLHRGDLIVFDYPLDPTKRYLKRIVALGGDTIEIRQGQIILNGKPVERLASDQSCGVYEKKCTIRQETLDGKTYRVALLNDDIPVDRSSREFGPVTIPEGRVFVLGDNRDNSADSRYWGNVPVELITAKPKFVYWPWSRINQRVE
jgi:signal peptidase I